MRIKARGNITTLISPVTQLSDDNVFVVSSTDNTPTRTPALRAPAHASPANRENLPDTSVKPRSQVATYRPSQTWLKSPAWIGAYLAAIAHKCLTQSLWTDGASNPPHFFTSRNEIEAVWLAARGNTYGRLPAALAPHPQAAPLAPAANAFGPPPGLGPYPFAPRPVLVGNQAVDTASAQAARDTSLSPTSTPATQAAGPAQCTP